MIKHYAPINVKARGYTSASTTRRKPDGDPYLTPTRALTNGEPGWLIQTLIECRDGRIVLDDTWFRTKQSAERWYRVVKDDNES
jgi:hypothetical protein